MQRLVSREADVMEIQYETTRVVFLLGQSVDSQKAPLIFKATKAL